jgi:hypothetical protein
MPGYSIRTLRSEIPLGESVELAPGTAGNASAVCAYWPALQPPTSITVASAVPANSAVATRVRTVEWVAVERVTSVLLGNLRRAHPGRTRVSRAPA